MTPAKKTQILVNIFKDYMATIQSEVDKLSKTKNQKYTVEFETNKFYKPGKGYDIWLVAKLRKKK